MIVQPGLQAQLAARLRRETTGEVLFSRADRGRYATDASIYQVEPVGVLVPRTIEDVRPRWRSRARAASRSCRAAAAPANAARQSIGRLVLDCSKYLRNVLRDRPRSTPRRRRAGHRARPSQRGAEAAWTVLSGRSVDPCPLHDRRHGGQQFLRQQVDPLRADGRQRRGDRRDPRRRYALPLRSRLVRTGRRRRRQVIGELMARLQTLGQEAGDGDRRPVSASAAPGRRLQYRRADAGGGRRRAGQSGRLLVGSEGTLAFSAALELILHPIKPRKVLGICQFPSFRAAMEATRHLVALDPEAVELVDRTMIDLGRAIPIYPQDDRPHGDRRAREPADRRIPRHGGSRRCSLSSRGSRA